MVYEYVLPLIFNLIITAWMYSDAKDRNGNKNQALGLGLALGIFGLIVWLFIRPSKHDYATKTKSHSVAKQLFINPEIALGTKSEWMKCGLIILGIIGISILLMINPDYIPYGILAFPIWFIFVWFVIPKIIGKKK